MTSKGFAQKIRGNIDVTRNVGWLAGEKIARLLLGLFVTALVARYLGPSNFGLLSYSLAFVALFASIMSVGTDGIIIRDLVSKPNLRAETITSGLVLRTIGAISSIACIFLIIFTISTADESRIYVAIISIGLAVQAFDIGDLWFQSQTRSKYAVIARLSSFIVFSIVKLLLIADEYPLVYFVYATLGETILGSIILLALFLKDVRIKGFRFNLKHTLGMAREGVPYMFSSIAIMLYMRIDQIMLKEIGGSYEAGIYSAALRFSEIWYLIPSVLVSSLTPKLARLHGYSKIEYFETLQSLTTGLVRLSIIISIVVTILAGRMVTAFFGPDFSDATYTLIIHIWSSIFVFAGIAVSPWVVHERISYIAIWPPLFGAVANIILNIALIPRYGATGCAVATLIAYAASSWIANSFFQISYPVFRIQTKAILGLQLK